MKNGSSQALDGWSNPSCKYLVDQFFQVGQAGQVFRVREYLAALVDHLLILPCDLSVKMKKRNVPESCKSNSRYDTVTRRVALSSDLISSYSIREHLEGSRGNSMETCCVGSSFALRVEELKPVAPVKPGGPGRPGLPRPGRPGGPINLAVNSVSWSCCEVWKGNNRSYHLIQLD